MTLWLTLHLLGVVLFVGNIITAAFWKVRADLGKHPAVIHSAAQNVMLADWCFTLPGLLLILISGVSMAIQGGLVLAGWNWLSLSLLLFAITGAIWLGLLIPLQRKMIRLSHQAVRESKIPAAYQQVSRQWAIWGTLATLLPLVILYLMIGKGL